MQYCFFPVSYESNLVLHCLRLPFIVRHLANHSKLQRKSVSYAPPISCKPKNNHSSRVTFPALFIGCMVSRACQRFFVLSCILIGSFWCGLIAVLFSLQDPHAKGYFCMGARLQFLQILEKLIFLTNWEMDCLGSEISFLTSVTSRKLYNQQIKPIIILQCLMELIRHYQRTRVKTTQ